MWDDQRSLETLETGVTSCPWRGRTFRRLAGSLFSMRGRRRLDRAMTSQMGRTPRTRPLRALSRMEFRHCSSYDLGKN